GMGKSRLNLLPLDTIRLGRCEDLFRELPDESVDLIISSPPYNLGKEYEAKRALAVYLQEQSAILQQCARVLKPMGSICWQVGAFSDDGLFIPLDIRMFPILESLNLIPRNRIVWIRQHGLHAQRRFSCRHETILWFTKTKDYVFNLDQIRVPQKYQNKKAWQGEAKGKLTCNPAGKNPGDVWVFRNVKHNHEEQTVHPCQFPEDLITRLVLALTKKGGIVLDPYMGTGTVAVVARDCDRHYIGSESEPKYHEVSQRRLHCKPNDKGSFANLKSLRDYVERTGEPIERFRFDVQVGNRPTERSKAKIYPEEHHAKELEDRLSYEEDHFSARVNGRALPESRDFMPTEGKLRRKNAEPQYLPLFPSLEELKRTQR
ncbi:MAG: site-specific DNA-methyltransferase, partial [Nitrososphaera sp.]|nr:site-specific DNA-methyltransferase [Nitrososphaera sp.]